ncbi:MAG: 30S ribosomal protein S9 [Candidatus Spechtbacterales bacterium]
MAEATETKKDTKPKAKTATKTKAATKPKAKPVAKKSKKADKYYEAVGRRKTSIARVRIWDDDSNSFFINEKDIKEYMPTEDLLTATNAPLRKIKMIEKFKVTAKVNGGGSRGQAEAIRHGLARALVKYDPELRLRMKKSGYLKRDPRAKERKKPGLKKARKAAQWSKR